MKETIKNYITTIREQFRTRSSKVGSYSFILTAVVLAILITVNAALGFLHGVSILNSTTNSSVLVVPYTPRPACAIALHAFLRKLRVIHERTGVFSAFAQESPFDVPAYS